MSRMIDRGNLSEDVITSECFQRKFQTESTMNWNEMIEHLEENETSYMGVINCLTILTIEFSF